MSLRNTYARFKRNISEPQYEWQVSKGQYPKSKLQPFLKGRKSKNASQAGKQIKSAEYMINVENKADATGRKVENFRSFSFGKLGGEFTGKKKLGDYK